MQSIIHNYCSVSWKQFECCISPAWKFDKITIIHEDPSTNTAEVNYSVKRVRVTAFGKYKNFKNGDQIDFSIMFKKFNDGWNISDKKTVMKNVGEVECL